MVIDFNVLKIDVLKLIKKDRMDLAYKRMYSSAEELANKEVENYKVILLNKIKKESILEKAESGRISVQDYVPKLYEYKLERIKYHMAKMERILNSVKDK